MFPFFSLSLSLFYEFDLPIFFLFFSLIYSIYIFFRTSNITRYLLQPEYQSSSRPWTILQVKALTLKATFLRAFFTFLYNAKNDLGFAARPYFAEGRKASKFQISISILHTRENCRNSTYPGHSEKKMVKLKLTYVRTFIYNLLYARSIQWTSQL